MVDNKWDLWVWHLLTPFPKDASHAKTFLQNLWHFICAGIVYGWAAGQDRESIRILVGAATIFPLLISGVLMQIVSILSLIEWLESMETRYQKNWKERKP